VQIEAEKHQTAPHDKGGKNPKWNETLQFATKGKFVRVEVYDKDSMSSDDLCGTGSADIRLLLANPGKTLNVFVELKEEGGDKSGTILLECEYQGEAVGW
jgi:Ca2+-dependent lipid-binding protein